MRSHSKQPSTPLIAPPSPGKKQGGTAVGSARRLAKHKQSSGPGDASSGAATAAAPGQEVSAGCCDQLLAGFSSTLPVVVVSTQVGGRHGGRPGCKGGLCTSGRAVKAFSEQPQGRVLDSCLPAPLATGSDLRSTRIAWPTLAFPLLPCWPPCRAPR